MKTNMFLIVAGIEKLLFAVLTFINSLAAMNSQMHLEVAIILIGLTTQVTKERPFTYYNTNITYNNYNINR